MPLSDSFAEFGTLIAAAITAVATGALAWVAWHELRAVRLGLEEQATAREQDYIALADQLAVAREQLDLARRPFAIAHRPSEGHMAVVQSWLTAAYPATSLGTAAAVPDEYRVNVDGMRVFVTVRNAGQGVARHVQVRAAVIYLGEVDGVRSLPVLDRPVDFEAAEVDILAPGEEHVLRWTRVSSTWSATPPYGLLCETTCYDEAGEPRTLVTAFRAKRAL